MARFFMPGLQASGGTCNFDSMNNLPEYLSKKTKSGLLKLAIYQMAGGIFGILFIVLFLWGVQAINWKGMIVYSVGFILFAYSVFCGVLLLRSKEAALNCSLFNQLIQFISFALFGFAFKFTAGIFLSPGIDLTKSAIIDCHFGLSRFEIAFQTESDKIELNFNLVALYLVYYIDKMRRKIREEKMTMEVANFGEPAKELM
jgi:hypothetical protein